jgi:hypothetical protein
MAFFTRQISHKSNNLLTHILEDDFRNPDGVGIARPAPGQVVRVLVKPAGPFPGETSHRKKSIKDEG